MSALSYRAATTADLPFIVGLIALDDVSDVPADHADQADLPAYQQALIAIERDPNQMLVVATIAGKRVGTLQLSILPGIARRGMWRGLLEAVHIAPEYRNRGLGSEMIAWAIETCRARGCGMVQLTSNKKRVDAHRFYRRLGFEQSHEGFKLYL